MKIKCLHGFFIFEEEEHGEVSKFSGLFGLSMAPWRSAFTFEALELAPDYSLQGKPLLGLPAIVTHEGEPWEVLEANGFVFNFNMGLVVPIASVLQAVEIGQAGSYLISEGLILPGSLTADGDKVKSYSGWFDRETMRFTYSEVTFV